MWYSKEKSIYSYRYGPCVVWEYIASSGHFSLSKKEKKKTNKGLSKPSISKDRNQKLATGIYILMGNCCSPGRRL